MIVSSMPDDKSTQVRMPIIEYGLQPAILIAVMAFWLSDPTNPLVYPLVLAAVHLLLGGLEYWRPARPDWLQPAREKLLNVVLVVILTIGVGIVAGWYDAVLREPLANLRGALNLDIWPHEWPVLAQVFLVFLAGEFIWYWVHRAEHRWALVWRVSGHGAHHSFKKLGALNFGLNHPLEFFFLVAPSAFVELLFGVGIAAAGATILGVVQASIAHSNIRLNSRVIGWLFTTNEYHIHHHSVIMDESNTNYGCSAIVWDRLFGTFEPGPTLETGTGPTEPTLWQKTLMPLREPEDTAIAP